ncbi:hypothetical protein BKI52_03760 [marine bacterium AO1-C]|nr:hypothetical protein BKI52_03760 [marine bacterium AO1-C]
MKKTILTTSFIICCCYFGKAQELTQGQSIKEEVLKVFGGKTALQTVKTFAYTLEKGVPDQPKTAEKVMLNFTKRFIKKTFEKEGKTISHIYQNGKGWEMKQGKKTPLTDKLTKRLTNNFFYNFIGMLQDNDLQWKFIKNTTYRAQDVRIVRVMNDEHQLDLFVNKKGEVVTSSTPNESGKYNYYADEYEYKAVGKGIRFPLIFRVFKAGKCTYEGMFKNVVVK